MEFIDNQARNISFFYSDFSDFAQSCLVQCQKSNHAFMTNSLNMVKFWTIEKKIVITYYQISFSKKKNINDLLLNYYQVWNIMSDKTNQILIIFYNINIPPFTILQITRKLLKLWRWDQFHWIPQKFLYKYGLFLLIQNYL